MKLEKVTPARRARTVRGAEPLLPEGRVLPWNLLQVPQVARQARGSSSLRAASSLAPLFALSPVLFSRAPCAWISHRAALHLLMRPKFRGALGGRGGLWSGVWRGRCRPSMAGRNG